MLQLIRRLLLLLKRIKGEFKKRFLYQKMVTIEMRFDIKYNQRIIKEDGGGMLQL